MCYYFPIIHKVLKHYNFECYVDICISYQFCLAAIFHNCITCAKNVYIQHRNISQKIMKITFQPPWATIFQLGANMSCLKKPYATSYESPTKCKNLATFLALYTDTSHTAMSVTIIRSMPSENWCFLLRIMLHSLDLAWLAPLKHCWLSDCLLERHRPHSKHRLNFAPQTSIFTIFMKVSSLELSVSLAALYFGKDISCSSSVKPKRGSKWTFLPQIFLQFHLEVSHTVCLLC